MSKPAARITDPHVCPMVIPGTPPIPHVGGPVLPAGAPTVLIAGLAAARVGDMAFCVGPPDVIAMGSFTVLIEGKAAARMGDMTAHGGTIAAGCPTVLIGDSGGGAGGPAGATMKAAKAAAAPFVKKDCAKKAALAAVAGHPALAGHDDGGKDPGAGPEEAEQEKKWVEIELVDSEDQPVAYEKYRVTAADGSVYEGWTSKEGKGRVDGLEPGECKISFPDLDARAWEKA